MGFVVNAVMNIDRATLLTHATPSVHKECAPR
jgi:hypothetical protein